MKSFLLAIVAMFLLAWASQAATVTVVYYYPSTVTYYYPVYYYPAPVYYPVTYSTQYWPSAWGGWAAPVVYYTRR